MYQPWSGQLFLEQVGVNGIGPLVEEPLAQQALLGLLVLQLGLEKELCHVLLTLEVGQEVFQIIYCLDRILSHLIRLNIFT